ncbi:expressed unknown protein [Seminavis robusta]|uniref:Uncharacterized protein n=1 Tax=Seminavis robusta TaxID=568900 RepID=A0A9N8EG23_9STRA|nr:expressed unknown protein [Seminavis robusta]|eukprot:Sro1071_g237890.1 n/a (156) ;mRNA; f:11324-11791
MAFSHPTISNDKWAAVAGTAFAGIATGCLTFVSFVDARSFLTHVDKNENDLIQRHFPVWWPNGRDLMVPVLLSGAASNTLAYLRTNHVHFAITAGLLGLIGPYTAIILGEDIEALRQSDLKEVGETARSFCNLHHPRLIAAAAGFGLALVALADL